MAREAGSTKRPLAGLAVFYPAHGAAADECSLELLYVSPDDVLPEHVTDAHGTSTGKAGDKAASASAGAGAGGPASSLAGAGQVTDKGSADIGWDFTPVHAKLDEIKARGNHAIVRLSDLRPGSSPDDAAFQLRWPQHMKRGATGGGRIETETVPAEAGYPGGEYARWDAAAYRARGKEHNAYEWYLHQFIIAAARELNAVPTVAFVQGFIGHWSEGHVWGVSPETIVRRVWPNAWQYKDLLACCRDSFTKVRWSIGIAAGEDAKWLGEHGEHVPRVRDDMLATMRLQDMGTFEDALFDVREETQRHNAALLRTLGPMRWHWAPRGGEMSWTPGTVDAVAASPDAARRAIRDKHVTFCLAGQLFADGARIDVDARRRVADALGYRFVVHAAAGAGGSDSAAATTVVTVVNDGCAPVVYPTRVYIGSVTTADHHDLTSLKGNGDSIELVLPVPFDPSKRVGGVELRCDRALPGQSLPFEVLDLAGRRRGRLGCC